MIIGIISLVPIALLFSVGLVLHCWALFCEQREKTEAEEIEYNEIREQHREQAKSDMADLNVFATIYGGVKNE